MDPEAISSNISADIYAIGRGRFGNVGVPDRGRARAAGVLPACVGAVTADGTGLAAWSTATWLRVAGLRLGSIIPAGDLRAAVVVMAGGLGRGGRIAGRRGGVWVLIGAG